MVRIALAGIGAGVLAVLLAADGRASLHDPEDPPVGIPVNDDGTPEALPFLAFESRRATVRNQGEAAFPLIAIDRDTKEPLIDKKTGQPILSDRGKLDARIKLAQKKKARTPDESAALAIDLIRFRNAPGAEVELKGLRRGFLPNVTLAHSMADQGRWAEALEYLDIANSERPPASLPGTSPKKLAWQLKLNKGPLMTLFRLRAPEARAQDDAKRGKSKLPPELLPENELPDRIFGVDFANPDADKAKLPPDALATAQQLVLWFPFDVRLYWLLAEVYAATGDVRSASKILDQCAWSLGYSNRKVLMQHREAMARAVAALPPDQPTDDTGPPPDLPPPDVPFSMSAVWWYFGVVALFALLALGRAIMRMKKVS